MDFIEDRFHELGSVLPPIAKSRGSYLSSLIVDKMFYLAGVISIVNGAVITGGGGADKAVEEGYTTARHCTLIQFASIKRVLGLLDWLQQIISLNGYVSVIPGFTPLVINRASDFRVKLFGEKGLHVQAAVGVSTLSRRCSLKSR
jgi:enamine deaminase RidA (YjgF/YER057c/UK114 family)